MLPVGEIPTFPAGGSEVDAAAEIEDHESGARGSSNNFCLTED
jgi:alcohol dehydrogenase YqhD (iron-dependent ADH family)